MSGLKAAKRLTALTYDLRITIYDMGVRRLRREFGKREGFLSSIMMMTACSEKMRLSVTYSF